MLFLGNLLYIAVLLTNAIAILSEDRFLARINLSRGSYDPGFGASDQSNVMSRLVNIISSVQTVARAPLILVNVIIIVYELVLG